MGSCCFTPSKKDFLWWYWLLLASVVGIPMFLAVIYLNRHKDADEGEKIVRGKIAGKIFWYSSVILTILLFLFFWFFVENTSHLEFGWALVPSYLVGVAYLSFVAARCRKCPDPAFRIVMWGGQLFFWYIGSWFLWVVLFLIAEISAGILGLLGILVWQLLPTGLLDPVAFFAALILPGYYWAEFKANPVPKTAWKALVFLMIGAVLFWAAVRYVKAENTERTRMDRMRAMQEDVDRGEGSEDY